MSLTVRVTLRWAADAGSFVPPVVEKGHSFLLLEVNALVDLPLHDVYVRRATTPGVSKHQTYEQPTLYCSCP